MTRRRVAVTGLGVVAPIGSSVEEVARSLAEGRSGVCRLAPSLCERLRSPIGAPSAFDGKANFDPARLRLLDRVTQLALAAAAQALADARIDLSAEQRERCGVFVGSGMGGAETTDAGYRTIYADASDRVNPYTVLAAMTNAHQRARGSVSSMARKNAHMDNVMLAVSITSGIRMRVKRKRPKHVDMQRPA